MTAQPLNRPMSQTIRQRRDLRLVSAKRAVEAYTDESLRWELERAERTELVHPEPVQFCWPSTPEPCCFVAPVEAAPSLSMPMVIGACIAGPAIGAAVWCAAQWAVNLFLGVSV